MLFKTLLTLLTLLPSTLTQTTKIQFTQIPGPATIGQPSTIKWTGGNSDPVTLILLEGDLTSPRTVSIIAPNVNGNSYTWTPSNSLTANDDYLLEIQQGLNSLAYSGQFNVQNASSSATTIYAVAGSSTVAISTVGGNATTTSGSMTGAATPAAGNATSTITLVAASASGTGGLSMPRNTTFVSQSLTPTGSATVTSTAVTTATTGTSAGGAAAARATAQGVFGLGAVAAAAMYLL